VALWSGLSGTWSWAPWASSWLAAANLTAFGYYGFDKHRARSGASRVPEIVLHGLTASGGGVGALAAMRLFRHKTLKSKFRLIYGGLVGLQLVLLAWIGKTLWVG
jgi:uncharacterized membrane protein YsdA (DUF1294 family)